MEGCILVSRCVHPAVACLSGGLSRSVYTLLFPVLFFSRTHSLLSCSSSEPHQCGRTTAQMLTNHTQVKPRRFSQSEQLTKEGIFSLYNPMSETSEKCTFSAGVCNQGCTIVKESFSPFRFSYLPCSEILTLVSECVFKDPKKNV